MNLSEPVYWDWRSDDGKARLCIPVHSDECPGELSYTAFEGVDAEFLEGLTFACLNALRAYRESLEAKARRGSANGL